MDDDGRIRHRLRAAGSGAVLHLAWEDGAQEAMLGIGLARQVGRDRGRQHREHFAGLLGGVLDFSEHGVHIALVILCDDKGAHVPGLEIQGVLLACLSPQAGRAEGAAVLKHLMRPAVEARARQRLQRHVRAVLQPFLHRVIAFLRLGRLPYKPR